MTPQNANNKKIKELQKENKELKDKLLLFQNLMDNIPDTIYFKDNKSRFLMINKAQVNLLNSFGKKKISHPEEAIGLTDADFFPGQHPQDTNEEEQRIIKEGATVKREEKHQLPSGKKFRIYSIKIAKKDRNGNIDGTLGISRDITKLKTAQEKLKSTHAKLKKFFTIVSHNLGNPFDTLIGFSKLLVNESGNISIEKIKKINNFIYESSQNAHTLLENLLHRSMFQTEKLECKPSKINLAYIINQNIESYSTLAKNKQIKLYARVSKNITAEADGNMVSTIVRNLINNALKFTPEGGTIKITANERKHQIEITVSDTGIGIKTKRQKELFNINADFLMAKNEEEKNAGLGLILCKELIEKNNGKIRVESKGKSEGSQFKFTLPKN